MQIPKNNQGNSTASYHIIWSQPKQVGYHASVDSMFVYWIEEDVIYVLGSGGTFQVGWVDEVDFSNIIELGDL